MSFEAYSRCLGQTRAYVVGVACGCASRVRGQLTRRGAKIREPTEDSAQANEERLTHIEKTRTAKSEPKFQGRM